MRILLITPPLTQLNTPYPATAYLKGYYVTQGDDVRQVDLGIEVVQAKDRYCYQISAQLDEKVSNAELTEILKRLMDQLEKRYPEDLTSMGPSFITIVADGRKTLEHLEKLRRG